MQSEFAQLDDESNIYKLIGPVLLKQDKTEAVMAVSGRLEFIEKEMWVVSVLFSRGLPFADSSLQQAHRKGD